jgi:hypothetical protein
VGSGGLESYGYAVVGVEKWKCPPYLSETKIIHGASALAASYCTSNEQIVEFESSDAA